jgi:hypothetical protein
MVYFLKDGRHYLKNAGGYMAQQRKALGSGNDVAWNRMEVNRCLLPVLRYVDAVACDDLDREELDELQHAAVQSCQARSEAYRQLSVVWQTGAEQTVDRWFGWIECDDELLQAAFDFIDDELNGGSKHSHVHISWQEDMYFSEMFRIAQDSATVDLRSPFEQFYFCDEVIYKDYQFRRLALADQCKAWIRRYHPYYQRIWAWYCEHGGRDCAVSVENHAYMELYQHFLDRIAYEDRLRDDRQALEYERGGLGWFHRERKRQIDRELHDLDLVELEMKLEDARERYDAYEAQFARHREAWEQELRCAPLTAFGRRKELKQKLAALQEQLANYRKELALDDLQAQYHKMSKKY